MPDVKVFIDSNTLLYSHDVKAGAKTQAAKEWLRTLADHSAGRTNLQVLNETANVMLRKRWFASSSNVFDIVDELRVFGDEPIGWPDVVQARQIHERYRYSWWDGLLLASALRLGCTHFLSEDLQDGQAVDGLTIVDPFAHSPRDVFSA